MRKILSLIVALTSIISVATGTYFASVVDTATATGTLFVLPETVQDHDLQISYDDVNYSKNITLPDLSMQPNESQSYMIYMKDIALPTCDPFIGCPVTIYSGSAMINSDPSAISQNIRVEILEILGGSGGDPRVEFDGTLLELSNSNVNMAAGDQDAWVGHFITFTNIGTTAGEIDYTLNFEFVQ